jgi:uncharacterized protein YggE
MKNRLLLAVAAAIAIAGPALAEKPNRTLAVTGTAEVAVSPDICYMTFTVITEHKSSAAKAYQENNQTMTAVRDAIRKAGVEPKDIQTQGFSITPQYHWNKDHDRNIFDGYKVAHNLHVKVRDLEGVSGVLDAAVTAGATQVSGVDFTVENPKKYLLDARVEAIKAARKKAELIAETAGVELLKPITISEYEPGGYRRFAQANVAFERNGGGGGGASLAPGEVKLTITMNITYEIR